jgi:hypothetical protein
MLCTERVEPLSSDGAVPLLELISLQPSVLPPVFCFTSSLLFYLQSSVLPPVFCFTSSLLFYLQSSVTLSRDKKDNFIFLKSKIILSF